MKDLKDAVTHYFTARLGPFVLSLDQIGITQVVTHGEEEDEITFHISSYRAYILCTLNNLAYISMVIQEELGGTITHINGFPISGIKETDVQKTNLLTIEYLQLWQKEHLQDVICSLMTGLVLEMLSGRISPQTASHT